MLKGFVQNIEGLAVNNDKFRQVLYTVKNAQLVLMALKPQEDIGAEIHKVDQFSMGSWCNGTRTQVFSAYLKTTYGGFGLALE